MPAYTVRPGFISTLIVAIGLSAAFGTGVGYTMARKDVTFVTAGQAVPHTTFARTVRQALVESGIRLRPLDEVSTGLDARLSDGLAIVIRRAVPVTLMVDGKAVRMESAAPNVTVLLARRGVHLAAWDKVYPSRQTVLSRGLRVRVVRIRHTLITKQTEVPFQVHSSRDPRTPRGIIRVLAAGRPGLRERVWKVTYADGVAVDRTLIGERIARSPLDRVITIGTQVLLASRGRFAGKEMLDMLATAYAPFCCPGVDDVTAIGMRAGYGVVAVDPSIIPLGSRLFIEGYGYALAGDTGRAIRGLRIDLGFDTRHQAVRFGRRAVRVYIIAKKVAKK